MLVRLSAKFLAEGSHRVWLGRAVSRKSSRTQMLVEEEHLVAQRGEARPILMFAPTAPDTPA